MKTDTTLFEIYSELGLLEVMQDSEMTDAIADMTGFSEDGLAA